METEQFVTVLEEAGLSPYEATVYVTLLDLGTASATAIADESGVPGPRIYDILRSLADRGYVETYQQGTLQARAHDPTDVIGDLHTGALLSTSPSTREPTKPHHQPTGSKGSVRRCVIGGFPHRLLP